MKKNILYLGKLYPKKILSTLFVDSKGKAGLSNHNFEVSILNGLCQQDDIVLKSVILPGVFSFPHNNKRLFTRAEHYDYKGTELNSVGFCNLVVLKEFCSTFACFLRLLKTVNKFDGDRVDIIMNTPDTRFFNAIKWARRFTSKHLTQTVIIPDIPAMMTSMDRQNPIKGFFLNRNNQTVMEQTSNADGLVLLTEAMMDFVSKPVKHIVMEGIVDVKTMNVDAPENESGKEIILYTGTLRKIFGVMNLVQAFQRISNPDVELWICGSGDSADAIAAAAKQDTRIKFHGLVDSQMALQMQHQATILVNPRTSEGEYTKYSFPSKTMEYLLAGKSVIINRLPGIPEEYYNYAFTPVNESIEAFSQCIADVLNMDKEMRRQRAEGGRNFIVNKKNSVVQMRRVMNLIDSYQ